MDRHGTGAVRAADEDAIRSFPHRMIESWNRGSGEGFAACFGERADFVAFEGTHLKGRREIEAFHRELFDTAVKGTRLEGDVKFVRFLGPHTAVMHAVARVTLAGGTQPTPSRDSMQLFVATKRADEWHADAMLNARQLTIERQLFLDDFDSLSSEDQRKVAALVASLKQRHASQEQAG